MLLDFVGRLGKLHAPLEAILECAFPASAGMDLRLDNDRSRALTKQFLRDYLRGLRRIANFASRHCDPILREELFGLIFVNVHDAKRSLIPSTPNRQSQNRSDRSARAIDKAGQFGVAQVSNRLETCAATLSIAYSGEFRKHTSRVVGCFAECAIWPVLQAMAKQLCSFGHATNEIMDMMPTTEQAKAELLNLLRKKSVFHGDFTLASGAKSKYYFDCRLTTQDPKGAWLIGQLVHALIREQEAARKITVNAVGGLTMGADPVALATAMFSHWAKDAVPLQAFTVRKAPKVHGQSKLIEGNFHPGDTVVIVEDVVTRGDSTLAAIDAVTKAGGKVAFVVVLVDRGEGGREKIHALGHAFFCLFTRNELLGSGAN